MTVAVPFPTEAIVDLAPPSAEEVQLLDRPPEHLHVSSALSTAWDTASTDDEPFARWSALAYCPDGSLGQGVDRFYRARGFTFPGHPESAPPLLAQHDFIHVLADYGSTVECEIEVFGLISRANDDPAAFALLAMVLGLFETGYIEAAAQGFFGFDRGHLSADAEHMAARRRACALRAAPEIGTRSCERFGDAVGARRDFTVPVRSRTEDRARRSVRELWRHPL